MGLLKTIVGVVTGNPMLALSGLTSGKKKGLFANIEDISKGDTLSKNEEETPRDSGDFLKPVDFLHTQNNNLGLNGLDLYNQVPMFKNGGIPNNGKPAVIFDLRTKKPVGTMNEEGAERIVPAYADGVGLDQQSLLDEETFNLGNDNPGVFDVIRKRSKYGLGSQNLASNSEQSMPTIDNKQDELKSEDTGTPFDLLQVMKDLRPVFKIVGALTDARRQNLGMGARKGALTSISDWLDQQDKLDRASVLKANKTTTPKYDPVEVYRRKRMIDLANPKPSSSGGRTTNPYGVASAVDDFDKAMRGTTDQYGTKMPGIENATSLDELQGIYDIYYTKFEKYHPDIAEKFDTAYNTKKKDLESNILKEQQAYVDWRKKNRVKENTPEARKKFKLWYATQNIQ